MCCMACLCQVLEAQAARTEDYGQESSKSSRSSSSQVSREQAELLVRYQSSFDDEQVDHQLMLALLEHLVGEQPGAVLVFLPGYEDIMTLRSARVNQNKNAFVSSYIFPN